MTDRSFLPLRLLTIVVGRTNIPTHACINNIRKYLKGQIQIIQYRDSDEIIKGGRIKKIYT